MIGAKSTAKKNRLKNFIVLESLQRSILIETVVLLSMQ